MVQNVTFTNPEGNLSLTKLPFYSGLLALIAVTAVILHRRKVSFTFRFATNFILLSGFFTLSRFWAGVDLINQANRFHLVMDMAICLGAGFLASKLIPGRRLALVGAAVVLLAAGYQSVRHRDFAQRFAREPKLEERAEYKIAQWMEGNAAGDRVYVTGSTSFWFNYLTDLPQVAGCCDQNRLVPVQAAAKHAIKTDENAGDQGAEVSILWFQTFGAHYVAVSGPDSNDFYKDFVHPRKFEGILAERWRDDGNVIYEVPLASASLAHVVSPDELVSRVPLHGLDVDPLRPYVRALLDVSRPQARFEWKNSKEAVIQGVLPPGSLYSLQIPYHAGWRATANGKSALISQDALGMMTVAPECAGACEVTLIFDGGWGRVVLRVIAFLTWAGFAVFWVRARRTAPAR
jgi:hypothetical protein